MLESASARLVVRITKGVALNVLHTFVYPNFR